MIQIDPLGPRLEVVTDELGRDYLIGGVQFMDRIQVPVFGPLVQEWFHLHVYSVHSYNGNRQISISFLVIVLLYGFVATHGHSPSNMI
jgi:hypothetical protein